MSLYFFSCKWAISVAPAVNNFIAVTRLRKPQPIRQTELSFEISQRNVPDPWDRLQLLDCSVPLFIFQSPCGIDFRSLSLLN